MDEKLCRLHISEPSGDVARMMETLTVARAEIPFPVLSVPRMLTHRGNSVKLEVYPQLDPLSVRCCTKTSMTSAAVQVC